MEWFTINRDLFSNVHHPQGKEGAMLEITTGYTRCFALMKCDKGRPAQFLIGSYNGE